jgi:hypothetical protein
VPQDGGDLRNHSSLAASAEAATPSQPCPRACAWTRVDNATLVQPGQGITAQKQSDTDMTTGESRGRVHNFTKIDIHDGCAALKSTLSNVARDSERRDFLQIEHGPLALLVDLTACYQACHVSHIPHSKR